MTAPVSALSSTLPLRTLLVSALLLSACARLPVPLNEEEKTRAEVARQQAIAEEAQRQAARPANLCRAEPGTAFALRKKVLVLAMPLARPAEAADLPGISTAWPQALQRRLEDSPHFLVFDGGARTLDPERDPGSQILRLAREHDVQFILTGHIDSLAITPGQVEFKHLSELLRLRPIPLSMLDKRTLATRIDIYDGYSGSRLARLQHEELITTDVRNRHPGALKGNFFSGPLGESLAALLQRQFEAIEDELACLPMMARVLRENGGRYHISAGFDSNLHAGMRLKLVQRERLSGRDNAAREGAAIITEHAIGDLVIDQVQPATARGHLDSSQRPSPGRPSYVRAW